MSPQHSQRWRFVCPATGAPGRRLVMLLCTGFLAATVQAWEGHDWNQWRQVTTWQKPELRTDQAGQRELVSLLGDNATNRVASIGGWEERRKQIASTIQQIIGRPTDLKPPPLEVRELGVEDLEGYTRRHIMIRSEPMIGFPLTCWCRRSSQPRASQPFWFCIRPWLKEKKNHVASRVIRSWPSPSSW